MTSLSSHIRWLAVVAKHKGLIRTLEDFIEKEHLPAKDWPPYIKKEIFEKIPIKLREGYEATYDVDKTLERLRTPEGLKTFNQFKLHFDPQPKIIALKTDLSDFTSETIRDLKKRMDPSLRTLGVPHDEERRKNQKELLIKNKGTNPEPVILIEKDNKYEIREGWHRAIAVIEYTLANKQPSFGLKAYVGEEKPFKDLFEKFKNFLKQTPI